MNIGTQAWPVRAALMLALSGGGFLLITFYFGWLPWPRPQHCRALLCDPGHWQLLSIGIGFVLLGLQLLIPQHDERAIGLVLLAAIVALLSGVIGLTLLAA